MFRKARKIRAARKARAAWNSAHTSTTVRSGKRPEGHGIETIGRLNYAA